MSTQFLKEKADQDRDTLNAAYTALLAMQERVAPHERYTADRGDTSEVELSKETIRLVMVELQVGWGGVGWGGGGWGMQPPPLLPCLSSSPRLAKPAAGPA